MQPARIGQRARRPARRASNPPNTAQADISTASRLTLAELKTVDWPTAHVPTGALTKTADAEGRVTRRPIVAGEPLLEGALFEKGGPVTLESKETAFLKYLKTAREKKLWIPGP